MREPFASRSGVVAFARASVLAAAVLAATAATAPAQDRQVEALNERIGQLERQLRTLERNVYRGDPPPAAAAASTQGEAMPTTAAAQLQIRLQDLEEALRTLTGTVEENQRANRVMADRLERLSSDYDFRLRSLERGGAQPPAAPGQPAPQAQATPPTPPASAPVGSPVIVQGQPAPGRLGTLTQQQMQAAGVTPAPQDAPAGTATAAPQVAAVPPATPEAQYEQAYELLKQRDFPGAEAALRAFVTAHPAHALAGNAQYWLGETFYVRGDYPNAARAFAEGFQKYPKSGKAPDNLLKLGMTLAQLKRNDDACITFDKLASDYKDAPAAILSRADRERRALKCR
ncbi:MAG: tol-pal system protein YbgF [Alphaproteobacteria bacterium]